MKITYIYHSSFVIETEKITIIFDYWKDPAQIIPNIIENSKKLYVFSSHFHEDHFNPIIFQFRKIQPNVEFILSKDILKHHKAHQGDGIFLQKHDIFQDDSLFVKAYGSTDVGVSWYLKCEGKNIFHAGDLNDWVWNEDSEKNKRQSQEFFDRELADIAKDVKQLDVAMFPVDSRIEGDYMRGAREFVETIPTSLFIPMHFTAKPLLDAMAFKTIAQSNGSKFFSIKKEGDSIYL